MGVAHPCGDPECTAADDDHDELHPGAAILVAILAAFQQSKKKGGRQ